MNFIKPFRKDYEKRVRNFHKDFVADVLQTCLRIHLKDGKAYPLRIHKSVATRWKIPRWKVGLVLKYFEYLGFLKARLETVDEFKERVGANQGLVGKGWRRKYFYPHDGLPSEHIGEVVPYTKLTYDELEKPYVQITEYPV